MVNGKKVIGICIARINDSILCNCVQKIISEAAKSGYRVIIFNSYVDFYNKNRYDRGAATVYELVNYDIVDVVVLVYNSFVDKSVPEKVIEGAKQHSVPVVVLNGSVDGCVCVQPDYYTALKKVMNHVITCHGVTDTFFIAGKRNDADSQERLECYKEVLKENGLIVDESRTDYGEYWDKPAIKIIKRLLADGKKPPRAIFCANDLMAFAACNELKKHGYRVPEDVIVTGFDGIAETEYFLPRLTTCYNNPDEIAVLCVKAVEAAADGNNSAVFTYSYTACISESCGCNGAAPNNSNDLTAELLRNIHAMELHEDFEYDWIDRILEISCIEDLYRTISGCMDEDSYACLNSDYKEFLTDPNYKGKGESFTENLSVIGSEYNSTPVSGTMPLSKLIPDCESWNDGSVCILSSIYIGENVMGYYAAKIHDITASRRSLKRVLKTLNISFNIAHNYFRQMDMSERAKRFALTNNITGLPNLKGALKWFEEFSSEPENREIPISVSVYGLPKYSYILENYGNAEIEDGMRYVAEALKNANTKDCYVAHVAEDEFIVLNYYSDPNSINDIINKSTTVFFADMNDWNMTSDKEYYIEVNCGCTVASGNWNTSLESLIKFAKVEMYMNRMKYGYGAFIKDETSPKDFYKAFTMLIENNMFSYCFQPIVSAKTGEIYAYEALMRTDASIGMNPIQVLTTARFYGKLYEIEKATMFNVMERYATEYEDFGNRIVFINTIPNFFLNDFDREQLCKKYHSYMDRFVFELTEQNSVSDDELNIIRSMSGREDINPIAIDDYGTGHSNIVNLMRYAPQIIKIDRFLITDIQNDSNKQMFVRSTIDFARLNGIKVLAEGVETSEELRTVVELGVDLIQGYYTARPAPKPLEAIPYEIRQEIITANKS